MYRLEYWIGKNHLETILWSAPAAICYHKRNQLRATTHRLGELKVVKIQPKLSIF
jgi:hypothetical protein